MNTNNGEKTMKAPKMTKLPHFATMSSDELRAMYPVYRDGMDQYLRMAAAGAGPQRGCMARVAQCDRAMAIIAGLLRKRGEGLSRAA